MRFNIWHLRDRQMVWLVPLVVFFAFAKLGHTPIHQWDEARTGINAIDMLNNGDWINLHFAGVPDKIRAKPPLVVWMVAFNFSWLGYHPFSLRLHSAIAVLFIFYFVYWITRINYSPLFAGMVVLMLLSVRGILGFHVGRTGDFDAVLIAFLLAGMYFFLRFECLGKAHGIWGAAIAWGFAFWTKGPAMAVLWPGLFLWLWWSGKWGALLRNPKVYGAFALWLSFPLTWYLLIQWNGVVLEEPVVSGHNAFERMFLYDLVDRFTQTEFEGKQERSDIFFLWKCLRAQFAIWDFAFWGVLVGGFFGLARAWYQKGLPSNTFTPLLTLSVCIWLSLGIFLSIATATKFWYFSPALPFVAITVVAGLWRIKDKRPNLFLGSFMLIWLLVMYFRYFGPKPVPTKGSKADDFFTTLTVENGQAIKEAPTVWQLGPLPQQRILLDLHFKNPNLIYQSNMNSTVEPKRGDVFFMRNEWERPPELQDQSIKIIGKDENYTILQWQ